ncbi:tetratricopeptide repeat protein [Sulfitobacter mediterraneus]|uniref:heme biosynthesis protein HemY n=1 Tax=Sulfitobacter mediterraneus TaxID=83219 RepID=UPI0019319017|nr:heme biosynthesis HemY N-terminal domain-containing protein [Sulfitobacter mediterraneus]MBM1308659.1 tetratricopeptide repeat protein [Sulfitobacter mediterraneus]MBM1312544.1 tetratricopeptide repeat protein [Sulfitobacter mediterraneus]MBM1320925.1 tetratricopeptide repeat protein [Sulfitobacter mediterraneus]MBM1324813.1 tetratricopeptide repeat protein [Sulfitobacter mediterraneus]MBM1396159.1 tetratricopeptide repeat protein [Sulfitobacter mediterraneus]
MLWSLIKIILFVAAVAVLAWGAGFLLESEGGVQVTVLGTEYSFGPLQSVIAVAVLIIAVWLLIKVVSLLVATWHFLNGDETALSRYFDRNRERKGYDALAEGLMALASGEGRVAMAKAAKADKYLDKPALTNLLTAQAAELAGDRRKAEETYRKLVEDESTRFVGVRGIMKQKLADGDTETALKLAEKAFALKPKHEETGDVLLKLQAEKEDWSGARQTLSAKLKNGQLPRDVHKRRDAVLALSEAKDVIADGKSIEAREAAIEANKMSPDLVPAAVMAAHGYVDQGKPRYAARVLTKAWSVHPHPDLAAAFAAIEPDEKPEARIKRFNALVKSQPDHPETKMLLSELHIANEDFPQARRALGDLVESDPTARSVTLMAAIERGEGASDTIVKGWLARALTVSRGPQWICENCHHIHAEWHPICENCKSFDTLECKTPPMSEVAMPGGVQMLPLIVGAIEDNSGADGPGRVKDTDAIEDAELVDDPAEGEAKAP